jgi:2-oxoglutarate ferredoxin oxidoreductase subunit beta
MKKAYERPESLKKIPFRFCPGCGHGIAHRLIAQCIDELGIREKVIGIAPVGCAVFAYDYFNFDIIECAHGRPPAVATAIKRVNPDNIVFSYQGDGDLAAIGTAEIIHAANRGENLSIFFINNATYGMTGGQMAPTTLVNQRTATCHKGRCVTQDGYPLNVVKLISTIKGVSYAARSTLSGSSNIIQTKKHIRRVLENQINKKGFSFLEMLSPCPPVWGLTPLESCKWIDTEMSKVFKKGVYKDIEAKKHS